MTLRSRLDAITLTSNEIYNPVLANVFFGVDSSSGASSIDNEITVDNSSAKPNAQGIVNVTSNGGVIYLQPFNVVLNHDKSQTDFIFTPGDGLDVIHGFEASGRHHDTIALPSADFANFAAVLRNTGDVQGSAFITDPKTGDAIRLAGVTTAELKAHPKDITFYGS